MLQENLVSKVYSIDDFKDGFKVSGRFDTYTYSEEQITEEVYELAVTAYNYLNDYVKDIKNNNFDEEYTYEKLLEELVYTFGENITAETIKEAEQNLGGFVDYFGICIDSDISLVYEMANYIMQLYNYQRSNQC